jgi:hypothetical protein
LNRAAVPQTGVASIQVARLDGGAWKMAERVSLLTAARLSLARDLRLAFRRGGQLVQPLAFFAMVTMLFPLAISP